MKEKLYIWLADRLPYDLVKWCAVRVGASASWELEYVDMGEIGILDAVDLWEKRSKHRREPGFAYLKWAEAERLERVVLEEGWKEEGEQMKRQDHL